MYTHNIQLLLEISSFAIGIAPLHIYELRFYLWQKNVSTIPAVFILLVVKKHMYSFYVMLYVRYDVGIT